MTLPISRWSNSATAKTLPPKLQRLLISAHMASEANRPLLYTRHSDHALRGFADAGERCPRIHNPCTARAAERRGLVQIISSPEHGDLQLHITGFGIDALTKIQRTS